MTINKPKNEPASQNPDETAPFADSSSSNAPSEELYSPESSFLQIDSIAQRIASLTDNLQQPTSHSDWDSASEKIIAFESELARLQFEIQKQTQFKNQSQVGNELLGAVGEQLESLTEELRRTASQNNQYYEGNLGCIHAVLKELKADIESLTKQTKASETATALERLTQQVTATAALETPVQDLIEAVQAIGFETSKQITEVTLRQHFDSLEAELPSRDEFQNLATKIESTTDLLKIQAFPENRSDGTNTDELSEQIHALGEWLATTIGNPEEKSDNTNELKVLLEKMNSLEIAIGNQPSDSQSEQRLREMDHRLSQLTDRWANLETSIKETLAAPKSDGNTESIIDEMAEKLDSLSIRLENQSPVASPLETELQAKFDLLSNDLAETKSMVNQLTDCIGQLLAAGLNQAMPTPTPSDSTAPASIPEAPTAPEPQPEPTPKETKIALGSPSWEQQKQALLRDHGVSTPVAKTTEPESDVCEPKIDSSVIESEEAVASTTESRQPTDKETPTPELEDLKSELEEKLRRAEIEISIERAKLHQERRELETIQNEIHRQQVKIDAQGQPIPNPKDGESKEQSVRRWSRFLGN